MTTGFSLLRLVTVSLWRGQRMAVGFHTVSDSRGRVGHLLGEVGQKELWSQ